VLLEVLAFLEVLVFLEVLEYLASEKAIPQLAVTNRGMM
jgi:hypothetical protein